MHECMHSEEPLKNAILYLENVGGEWEMGNGGLTIGNALKFARHDFLNELQVILLYIDLGKIPEAKKKILDVTEGMRQLAMLEGLGLPATEMWISTFDWVYGAFSKTVICKITPGVRAVEDGLVVAYLKQVFQDAEASMDPAAEYHAEFIVNASSTSWQIDISVSGGPMDTKLPSPKVIGDFKVEEKVSTNQWTFTISGQ
ncbi:Spo0B domain-containing protein [Filibacter tadaridae]|uniref:SpoOB alpha-helical domain-containing protein n=1 Tax=Filibacter tadaridae TaxID=2483811 RepID=A0A3P5XD16_9BACL|nr:Spo0B domain-containing protein [Filibacter tadaridae]VDC32603.1 hypothetical protein FILTAD_02808 [Filibacter tadaridae]